MIIRTKKILSGVENRRGAPDRFSRVFGGKCASMLAGNTCIKPLGYCKFQDYLSHPDRLGKYKCTKKINVVIMATQKTVKNNGKHTERFSGSKGRGRLRHRYRNVEEPPITEKGRCSIPGIRGSKQDSEESKK